MSKTLVILNPISGHGNGEKAWKPIEAALREGRLDFDLARTTAPRSAVKIAEDAQRSGYETLISVGGDGTVNEIVNGMMRASRVGNAIAGDYTWKWQIANDKHLHRTQVQV
jgi:diacylglycerol kinase (ATP)